MASRRNPGPVHDNALKALTADELALVCSLVGVHVSPEAIQMSETLPGTTRYVDALVSTGSNHLMEVEFYTHPHKAIPTDMLAYRSAVMSRYRGFSLDQHILVLGVGNVPDHIRDRDVMFAQFQVTYLRDIDPHPLLAHPSLAPLAALGKATPGQRQEILMAALDVIRTHAPLDRTTKLTNFALTLASIRLPLDTIDHVRKDIAMPIYLEDTPAGKRYLQQLTEQIQEKSMREGLEQGLEQGLDLGQVKVLVKLLERRFGDHPDLPDIAHRLIAKHDAGAIDVILDATSLDELR